MSSKRGHKNRQREKSLVRILFAIFFSAAAAYFIVGTIGMWMAVSGQSLNSNVSNIVQAIVVPLGSILGTISLIAIAVVFTLAAGLTSVIAIVLWI